MSFPWSTAQAAAVARLLSSYNAAAYDPSTNPYGFGQGGHVNLFIPAIQDIASATQAAGDAAAAAGNSASAAATFEANAALSAARLTGTSTTSLAPGLGSKSFTTQAGKLFTVGGYVTLVSAADPTGKWMAGQVTAYSGTALTVQVTSFNGSVAAADWTLFVSAAPGAQGLQGLTGPTGASASVQWAFSNSITDADPGNGTFRLNSTTVSSVTQIFFDNLDRNSADVTTFLDAFDDSTNTALRGYLYLTQISDPTKFALFSVTGAVTNATGYRKVVVTHVASSSAFGNGEPVGVIFTRTGDKGVDGAGAGTVINDTTSADGRLVSFVGTTGTHVQDSGYVIGTSGHSLAALDGANTWSAAQSFGASCTLSQALYLAGDNTPSQITANQNDYNPASLSSAAVLRLSSDASRNITGLQGGADGRILKLLNVGSFPIVLKAEDSASTAANRFAPAGDVTLGPNQVIELIYDSTASRWRGGPPASIADGSLTNAKLADMANLTLKGRIAGTTGAPQDITAAQLRDFLLPVGSVVDSQYAEYTTSANLATTIPDDDTIPTSTEGTQILSVTITPKSSTNKLRIRFGSVCTVATSGAGMSAALYNGGANAIRSRLIYPPDSTYPEILELEHEYTPGGTTAITLTIRIGATTGNIRANGYGATRVHGGAQAATLVVEEIRA